MNNKIKFSSPIEMKTEFVNSIDYKIHIETKIIGKYIVHYKKIDSTQKEIWRRIEKDNIENGTLIMADMQTSGIGTHGRTWYTTDQNNIAFSFVVYPNVQIRKLENITIQIAKILVEIFELLYKIKLKIKSPNDIMIKNKKIGGILTQTKLHGENVKCLVIGIGVNTNQQDFQKELEDIATSIKNEYGIYIDNKKIITEFCKKFEKWYIENLYLKNVKKGR